MRRDSEHQQLILIAGKRYMQGTFGKNIIKQAERMP
jgi:hypothetical protein